MSILQSFMSFILHIDKHLIDLTQDFGGWSYAILFLIIFAETGLVVVPFLPGDSLLFASGALATKGAFSLTALLLVLFFAAVIGDSVNYHIGKRVGTRISSNSFLGKFINQKKIDKAEEFFENHGRKTILLARFVPFIRTFAPFVAGASRMNFRFFLFFNILGALLWVGICTVSGYLFGNIPIVKNNFSTIILLVILATLIPAAIGIIQGRLKQA